MMPSLVVACLFFSCTAAIQLPPGPASKLPSPEKRSHGASFSALHNLELQVEQLEDSEPPSQLERKLVPFAFVALPVLVKGVAIVSHVAFPTAAAVWETCKINWLKSLLSTGAVEGVKCGAKDSSREQTANKAAELIAFGYDVGDEIYSLIQVETVAEGLLEVGESYICGNLLKGMLHYLKFEEKAEKLCSWLRKDHGINLDGTVSKDLAAVGVRPVKDAAISDQPFCNGLYNQVEYPDLEKIATQIEQMHSSNFVGFRIFGGSWMTPENAADTLCEEWMRSSLDAGLTPCCGPSDMCYGSCSPQEYGQVYLSESEVTTMKQTMKKAWTSWGQDATYNVDKLCIAKGQKYERF